MEANTLFTGMNIIELEVTNSTNNYARQLLESEKPLEGTVVVARHQTKGRGQHGHEWISERGKNLTCSYIFYPVFLGAEKHFYLNMVASLATKEVCEVYLEDEVKVKWPNDVYFGKQKIAGILIENTISGSSVITSIVGIGINVNQTDFDASLPNPTSIASITGRENDVAEVLHQMSIYLEKYYLQLRKGNYHFLQRAYTESLFRYNQTAYFKRGEQIFKGEVAGIARDGKLIIHSSGKEMRFTMQEIQFII